MEKIISRILDVLERWLPKAVVQMIIGLVFWMAAVWVLASWPGAYGITVAGLMAVAGALPVGVAVRDTYRGYRMNRCPVGDTWVSRPEALMWLLSQSGMFSDGSIISAAARNMASGVIDDLSGRHPVAVRQDGDEINLRALRWYSARRVSQTRVYGTIKDGFVRWEGEQGGKDSIPKTED